MKILLGVLIALIVVCLLSEVAGSRRRRGLRNLKNLNNLNNQSNQKSRKPRRKVYEQALEKAKSDRERVEMESLIEDLERIDRFFGIEE